jgi:hypothetical protein
MFRFSIGEKCKKIYRSNNIRDMGNSGPGSGAQVEDTRARDDVCCLDAGHYRCGELRAEWIPDSVFDRLWAFG